VNKLKCFSALVNFLIDVFNLKVLVFYVGNILDDKKTLCNGCFLNRIIGFIYSLQVLWTVFVLSHVTGHNFLEDVHEDSLQFPSQINRFLCNRLDGPLKAFRTPYNV
jgi:hypothetical protein